MKRKYQRSIAYLVIALLGISLWHVWKSSKIADTITVYYQKNNPSNSEAYVRNNKQ